jgi:hypothetical protein
MLLPIRACVTDQPLNMLDTATDNIPLLVDGGLPHHMVDHTTPHFTIPVPPCLVPPTYPPTLIPCQVSRRLARSALDPLMGVVPPAAPVPPDAAFTVIRGSGEHSGLVCYQHRKLEMRATQLQQQHLQPHMSSLCA